jgi:thiamine-phosphate pyrophosphorylase
MRAIPSLFGFYGILTDPVVGYERLAEIMVKRGIPVIQLRMKDTPREEVLATAHRLSRIISGSGSRFIVNDDPEIAAEVGADGVHLGQNDMPLEQARRIVGPDAVIGISTHSPQQTKTACAQKPDYIGIGPVFPTPTKKNPDPVIGLATMKEMLAVATVPAVCIGGINAGNLQDVVLHGGRNFCVVRPLTQCVTPDTALTTILDAYARSLDRVRKSCSSGERERVI